MLGSRSRSVKPSVKRSVKRSATRSVKRSVMVRAKEMAPARSVRGSPGSPKRCRTACSRAVPASVSGSSRRCRGRRHPHTSRHHGQREARGLRRRVSRGAYRWTGRRPTACMRGGGAQLRCGAQGRWSPPLHAGHRWLSAGRGGSRPRRLPPRGVATSERVANSSFATPAPIASADPPEHRPEAVGRRVWRAPSMRSAQPHRVGLTGGRLRGRRSRSTRRGTRLRPAPDRTTPRWAASQARRSVLTARHA